MDQILKSIYKKNKQVSELVDANRPIVFDIGHMTIWDPDAIVLPNSGKEKEDYLRKIARADVQAALNQMYNIIDGEQVLTLPEGTTVLPRSKSLPKPIKPTKWELFAAKKGIKRKTNSAQRYGKR